MTDLQPQDGSQPWSDIKITALLFGGLALLLLLVFAGNYLFEHRSHGPLGPEKAPDGHLYTMEEREAMGAQEVEVQKQKAAAEAQAASAASEKAARNQRLIAERDGNFKAGVRFLKDGDYGQALDKFGEVQEVDPSFPGLRQQMAAAQHQKQAAEAVALRAKLKAEGEGLREARREYGRRLRNEFLDNGADIKVAVTGASADRLSLTYVLFNDVWSHKFGPKINDVCSLGFKRIEMSDGYDWGCRWTCR